MPRLPQISGRELVKAFKRDGWVEISQRGNHVKLIRKSEPFGKATVIIPQHKTIKKGTLSRILKDTSISLEKLKKML